MAGVNVQLTANTTQYVNKVQEAKKKGNADFKSMDDSANKAMDSITDAFSNPMTAIDDMIKGFAGLGIAAGALVAVGTAAVAGTAGIVMMATETAQAQKEFEKFATQANVTTQEMHKIGVIASTVGLSVEDMGSIMMDTMDKYGDYLTTGAGAFQDYADATGKSIHQIQEEMQGLNAFEMLQKVQEELDLVGASAAQQTFVLESLASNASMLAPTLKLSEDAVTSLLENYAITRVNIANDTAESLNQITSNSETLNNNFRTYMTETFSGIYDWVSKITKELSDQAAMSATTAKAENMLARGGTFNITKDSYQDFLDTSKAITPEMIQETAKAQANQIVAPVVWQGPGYENGAADRAKQVEEETTRLIGVITGNLEKARTEAEDARKASSVDKQAIGTSAVAAVSSSDKSDALDQLDQIEQRTKSIREDIEKSKQAMGQAGPIEQKALEDSIKNAEAQLEKLAETKKGLTDQVVKYNEQASAKSAQDNQKRIQAQLEAAATETEIAEIAHQQMLDNLQKHLNSGFITRAQMNQAVEKENERHQKKLADIEQKAIEESFKKQEELSRAKSAFATTDSERIEAKKQADLLAAEKSRELMNQQAGYEIVTLEDLKAKQAEIYRDYHSSVTEIETESINDKNNRALIQAQMEIEFLEQQYEQKAITEQQYAELRIESEKAVTEAKRQLYNAQLDGIESLFSGMSGLAEEGSKTQQALFALEKSATIARLTLSAYDAYGAVDKDPTLVTMASKNIAKMKVVADYTAKIAGASAVVLGQYHSGTDEVDQTGSYILKEGERVIQPAANKDLTRFLNESSKQENGNVTVHAPLTVQGGVDSETIKLVLYEHKQAIFNAVKLAMSEKPSNRL
ncbi:hypothetical protein ACET9H_16915 [Aeromonas media]|uniref:hypothetical protein n=1 Tax=Aeromonas media TaxID=651 RepID=UPI0038CF54FD